MSSKGRKLTVREQLDLDKKRERQIVSQIKKANPPVQVTVTKKHTTSLNRGSSGIQGVLDGLKAKIQILDKEIRDDKRGKRDYEEELQKLQIRKEDIQKRLTQSKDWLAHFDTDIGPFERKYAKMTEKMSDRYDIAKTEHAKGLQVLMDEFRYHPQFKRYNDQFTAVPFRPK